MSSFSPLSILECPEATYLERTPRLDVAEHLDEARRAGLRITHAIETHIHADFVSGAQEIQAALLYNAFEK